MIANQLLKSRSSSARVRLVATSSVHTELAQPEVLADLTHINPIHLKDTPTQSKVNRHLAPNPLFNQSSLPGPRIEIEALDVS